MAVYASSIAIASPGTSNDIYTLTTSLARQAKIVEVSIGVRGTASAQNELSVARVSVVGSGPTTQAAEKMDMLSPSALVSVANAWTGQPTPNTIKLLRLPVNSNGGLYRWVARQGDHISLYGNDIEGQISFRMTQGGSDPISSHVIWEET